MVQSRERNGNAESKLSQDFRLLQDDELDRVSGGVVPGDGGCIPPWLDKLIHHLPIPLPNPTFPKL